MTDPLYRCWTKATDAEPGPPRYSANWAIARRAYFRVYPDRVECGDWTISVADVRDAVLFTARQGFLPVFILSVQTADKTYQFGFNPWVHVADHLPFPFRRDRARLAYSPFSIAVRILVGAYLLYLAWQWLN